MSKIKFESEQREFIKFCIRAGASNIQIANDLCEMLAVPEDDKKERNKIYRRVQKTKGRMPTEEIGSISLDGPLSDTPQWRKMYLRCLLFRAKDEKLKAKILSDIDRLITRENKKSRTSVTDEDEVADAERTQDPPLLYTEGSEPIIEALPDFDPWDWNSWGMSCGVYPKDCHKNTFLPIDEYEASSLESAPRVMYHAITRKVIPMDQPIAEADERYIRETDEPLDIACNPQKVFVRKSDGQKVWQDGKPLTSVEEKQGRRIASKEPIARKAYLRNYYLKRGLEPPPDSVFEREYFGVSEGEADE